MAIGKRKAIQQPLFVVTESLDLGGNGNRIGGQGGREESASRAPKREPPQPADAWG
jgi:hypothetical protein